MYEERSQKINNEPVKNSTGNMRTKTDTQLENFPGAPFRDVRVRYKNVGKETGAPVQLKKTQEYFNTSFSFTDNNRKKAFKIYNTLFSNIEKTIRRLEPPDKKKPEYWDQIVNCFIGKNITDDAIDSNIDKIIGKSFSTTTGASLEDAISQYILNGEDAGKSVINDLGKQINDTLSDIYYWSCTDDKQVTEIVLTDSDVHARGIGVCFVTYADGKKWVVKPEDKSLEATIYGKGDSLARYFNAMMHDDPAFIAAVSVATAIATAIASMSAVDPAILNTIRTADPAAIAVISTTFAADSDAVEAVKTADPTVIAAVSTVATAIASMNAVDPAILNTIRTADPATIAVNSTSYTADSDAVKVVKTADPTVIAVAVKSTLAAIDAGPTAVVSNPAAIARDAITDPVSYGKMYGIGMLDIRTAAGHGSAVEFFEHDDITKQNSPSFNEIKDTETADESIKDLIAFASLLGLRDLHHENLVYSKPNTDGIRRVQAIDAEIALGQSLYEPNPVASVHDSEIASNYGIALNKQVFPDQGTGDNAGQTTISETGMADFKSLNKDALLKFMDEVERKFTGKKSRIVFIATGSLYSFRNYAYLNKFIADHTGEFFNKITSSRSFQELEKICGKKENETFEIEEKNKLIDATDRDFKKGHIPYWEYDFDQGKIYQKFSDGTLLPVITDTYLQLPNVIRKRKEQIQAYYDKLAQTPGGEQQ